MPYVPRPATTASCAHCGQAYEQRNLRRKYCSNSCNVLASYARTGSREPRISKADLERSLATLIELMTAKERAAAPAPKKPGLAEARARTKQIFAEKEAPKKPGLAEARARTEQALTKRTTPKKRAQ